MPPHSACSGRGALTGHGNLRDLQGRCDLCGEDCYPNEEICVALSCNSQKCDCEVYHQGCLEKYLKAHRLEYNRKTGFQCPRGYSKSTASGERCRGKIEKSHPIVPRSEKKAIAKAVPAQVLLAQTKAEADAKRREQTKAQQAAAAAKKRALPGQVLRKAPPASHITGPAVVAQRIAATAPAPPPEPEAPAGPKELPPGMPLEMVLNKAQLKRLKKKEARVKAAEAASGCTGEAEGSVPDPSEWPAGGVARGEGAGGSGGTVDAAALMGARGFVQDAASYARLLGMYLDSDDDEDGSEEEGGEGGGGDYDPSASEAGPSVPGDFGDASLAAAAASSSGGSESGAAAGAPPSPLACGAGASHLLSASDWAPQEGEGSGAAGYDAQFAAAVQASAAKAQAGLASELAAEREALETLAHARAGAPPLAPIPVPVPAPLPAVAAPPPPAARAATALPDGMSRAAAAEQLIARMMDAPAFAEMGFRFLEHPEEAQLLGAAAELAYGDFVTAINEGRVEAFEYRLEAARDTMAAAAARDARHGPPATHARGASAAPAPCAAPAVAAVPVAHPVPVPMPVPVHVLSPVPVPVPTAAPAPVPAVAHVPAPLPAAVPLPLPVPLPAAAPLPKGLGEAAEDEDDLDDLMALCGVGA